MPLIDYSNISTYNIASLQNSSSLLDVFKNVDNIFGVPYLFGTTTLVMFFIVFTIIFKDYNYKVGILYSSTITLFIAMFYYFTSLITWQHLIISFVVMILAVIFSWNFTE